MQAGIFTAIATAEQIIAGENIFSTGIDVIIPAGNELF
jgi:hypothetical protein